MLDMIRSDSSQVVNESIPQIYTKATEMRQIYRKIDKLEAFVKMIGNSVAGLEERVIKAETDLGAFPSTFKKILHTISIPSFLNCYMGTLCQLSSFSTMNKVESLWKCQQTEPDFAPSSSLVNTRQCKVQYCKTSNITKDVDSLKRSTEYWKNSTWLFCRNHLPRDNNRPSMSLQSSSRLKTIFRVLMKHLIDDFCFGIDMNQPE
ncbi:biogenesis of lysosome-related organelles complex 1 subunit 4 isoform 2-T2 [Cariama cristata]